MVVTAEAPEETLPLNDTDKGNFFRGRYAQYQHRKSALAPPTPLVCPTIDTAAPALRDVSPPRLITPPPEKLHDIFYASNKDLLDQLRLIIKPEYLEGQSDSCFIKDACLSDLRKKIEVIGCNMRTETNKKYYEILAKDRYNDSIDLKADKRMKYLHFFCRFCCPISKRAVQSFLQQMALTLDKQSKQSNILQLQKFGGTRILDHSL